MKKHTKIYMDSLGYSKEDFIPCELSRIKDLKQVSILLDRMHIIEKELNIRGVYIKSIEFEEIEFEESDLLNNLLIKE